MVLKNNLLYCVCKLADFILFTETNSMVPFKKKNTRRCLKNKSFVDVAGKIEMAFDKKEIVSGRCCVVSILKYLKVSVINGSLVFTT